jgi:hypothetical protein
MQIGQFWGASLSRRDRLSLLLLGCRGVRNVRGPYREVGQLLRSMMPAFVGQIVPRFPIID